GGMATVSSNPPAADGGTVSSTSGGGRNPTPFSAPPRAGEAPLAQGLHRTASSASDVVAPGQRFAGLEQRLEVAEHPAPATTGAHIFHPTREQQRQLRGAFEVVNHGQAGHTAV